MQGIGCRGGGQALTMQTLHTSVDAVERVIVFKGRAQSSYGGSRLHDSTTFEGRASLSLSRRSTMSRRYKFWIHELGDVVFVWIHRIKTCRCQM